MSAMKLGLGLAAIAVGLGGAVALGRRSRRALGGWDEDMAAYTLRRRFDALVREPDPDAMMVAEDFALEHGLKLSEVSRLQDHDREDGGNFNLSPLNPPDAPVQRVEWTVDKTDTRGTIAKSDKRTKFDVGVRVLWNNASITDDLAGGRKPVTVDAVTGKAAATKQAAAIAWTIAKRLKHLPASTTAPDARQVVWRAMMERSGAIKKLPKALLGRRTRSHQRS